ncbi:MAG: START domain-containing protein [Cocleimonas sp.]
MLKTILLISILFFQVFVCADENWRLIREEQDIQVYSRDNTDLLLKSVKGVVKINASLDDLLEVLADIKTCSQWLHQCKFARTIKQPSFIERYDYIVTDMPWPVWDRDVVVRSVFQQNRATKQVTITFSSSPDSVPLKSGLIRVTKMEGRMLLTPHEKEFVQVIYEVSVDPAGKIPKWLVNQTAEDFPFYSLKKLRELFE